MSNNKFAEDVHNILQEIEELLISKNEKYGNSALEPLGVFSQLSAKEGLLVRIDDKLKRIKNGSLNRDDEDVVNDLIGYLVLLKIHAKREQGFDELDGSHKWGKLTTVQHHLSGTTDYSVLYDPITTTNVSANGYPIGSGRSYTSSKSHNED